MPMQQLTTTSVGKFRATEGECSGGGSGTLQVWGTIGRARACADRARESPEWPVSLAARNYNASQRILELAQPKGLHPDFMPAREVPTRVSSFTTSANASVRVQKLAEPLIRELTCCSRHTHPSSVISTVSRSPQKAIASPRTIELSKPKQLHANYASPRDPEWPVTEAAKRAVATPRVLELAQPSTSLRSNETTAGGRQHRNCPFIQGSMANQTRERAYGWTSHNDGHEKTSGKDSGVKGGPLDLRFTLQHCGCQALHEVKMQSHVLSASCCGVAVDNISQHGAQDKVGQRL
ncbi:hypothetical protein IHE44_0013181 [Lamprotornis superbus]|uniref:Uncharacterized protein n=1 Tax=Lamprotornis superbus TaxID=245042 RepID=A0A835NE33_9PASS|nr:hypothetical protein IHE44_0013181 [Lamprotornis superbus]